MKIGKVCEWLLTMYLSMYMTLFLLICTCGAGFLVLQYAAVGFGAWLFMQREPLFIEQKQAPEKAVEENVIP